MLPGIIPVFNRPPLKAPVLLGSMADATFSASWSVVTTAIAPAGSVIVVSVACNGTASSPSVSDGVNTYTLLASTGATSALYAARLKAALPSGTTITYNSGSNSGGDRFMAAAYIVGAATTSADVTASSASTTATSGALAQPNEIALGMAFAYNSGASPGAITETSGFTSIFSSVNFGGDHFTVDFVYKIVSATTAVTLSWSASATSTTTVFGTLKGF